MEEKFKCQICECENELFSEEKLKEMENNLDFNPGDNYRICSNKCQERAIRFNACWNLKNKLKNISGISYRLFIELMEFPEAGGYASDKYEKMRINPALFIMTLDEKKFLRFIEGKIN